MRLCQGGLGCSVTFFLAGVQLRSGFFSYNRLSSAAWGPPRECKAPETQDNLRKVPGRWRAAAQQALHYMIFRDPKAMDPDTVGRLERLG